MENKNPKMALKVNVPEVVKTGVSSNIVFVTTTANGEVILDFIFTHPQDKEGDTHVGTIVSRVVLPIKVAKDLNMVLSSHLGKVRSE